MLFYLTQDWSLQRESKATQWNCQWSWWSSSTGTVWLLSVWCSARIWYVHMSFYLKSQFRSRDKLNTMIMYFQEYFYYIMYLCFYITGIGRENSTSLVKAAETCCTEDIYHFDDTERFFLVSCLALWYVIIYNHYSLKPNHCIIIMHMHLQVCETRESFFSWKIHNNCSRLV